jgi:hypothetical protein
VIRPSAYAAELTAVRAAFLEDTGLSTGGERWTWPSVDVVRVSGIVYVVTAEALPYDEEAEHGEWLQALEVLRAAGYPDDADMGEPWHATRHGVWFWELPVAA